MLISGFNDTEDSLSETAGFISKLGASLSYLSIPTRPPYIKTIEASDENAITMAYQFFTKYGLSTELLLEYEGAHTGFTGNAMEDIISYLFCTPLEERCLVPIIGER
jgi:wyosine [tRNA(Phe)-imidazoG37] synthetase (radical SAM superfamily)